MTRTIAARGDQPRMADRIGPGRLVLVVGPSGAGKDTLIDGARMASKGNAALVFPRRVVTRAPSEFEDHDTVDPETFDRDCLGGRFALSWNAHGHRYGIPVSIIKDIRCGQTVICNVSRTVVDLARDRYAHVVVVLIAAPAHVLEVRLVSRQRVSDGNLTARIARSAELDQSCRPNFVIRNVGRPVIGIRRLLNVIRDPEVRGGTQT